MTTPDRVGLRQLVLVSTAWREWPTGETGHGDRCRAFERLVGTLLGADAGSEGRAWLTRTRGGAVDPGSWLGGTRARDELTSITNELLRYGRRRTGSGAPLADLPPLTRHWFRVLCDPRRTGTVFPEDDHASDGAPARSRLHWTALDVRFLENANGCWIHLGFSFWAKPPPWRPEGAEDGEDGEDSEDTRGNGAPRGHQGLRNVLERRAESATQKLVDKHFGPTTTLIWGREYAPPLFWIATPAATQFDPARYLDRPSVVEGLVRPLLGRGHDDSGMASSVIEGSVLTLRRFRHEHAAAAGRPAIRPVYLLMPGVPLDNGQPRDDVARDVVALLTEFEAQVATEMHDIDGELEVWGTHVRVYQTAARQAATLWDALALHLPVRKGGELADVHRAIAMVHQTLLQGVADIADLVNRVETQTAAVDELQERLADLVHERLDESRAAPGRQCIGESLVEMGHIGSLRRLGNSVALAAQRVIEQYKDLLASIGHAFDERRVRELDVLQRASFSLSITIGAVTVVAVLDFLFNVKSQTPLPFSWGTRIYPMAVALLLGVSIPITLFRTLRRVRSAQVIGSADFRERYERLLAYLRDASTRELDRLTLDVDGWTELDRNLAARFAVLWDEATLDGVRTGDREREPAEDIARLTGEIEQWTLRTLLLTERPRRLWTYRLPRLTLLYRHCVALERSRAWDRSVPVVADVDLEQALRQEDYSRNEAHAIDRYLAGIAGPRDQAPPAGAHNGAESGGVAGPPVEEPRPHGAADLLEIINRVVGANTPARSLDRDNRLFVRRALHWLTERGVCQFIDVGTGVPGRDSVHELVEDSRVLYVDKAADAVAQGQALLTTQTHRTKIIKANMLQPAEIFQEAWSGGLLRRDEPVAVLFTRVLGDVTQEEAEATMSRFRREFAGLPADAYIVVSHAAYGSLGFCGLDHVTQANGDGGEEIRSRAAVEGLLEGLDLAVSATELMAQDDQVRFRPSSTQGVHLCGGIARVRPHTREGRPAGPAHT